MKKFNNKKMNLILKSALCLMALGISANAATFVVNSATDVNDVAAGNGICETAAGNGVCTLRAAITEANALAGDDTITLPAGTYTNTLVGVDDVNASGDLDITSNIIINGAGSGTTIIQAAATAGTAVERVIHFPVSNVTATINGVTIQNGRQPTATFGGGVRVNNAGDNVTFNNCIISNNLSGFGGGGIVLNAATAVVTLNNTTVTGNTAASVTAGNTGLGGGIFLNAVGATLNATNSIISNNTASSAATGTAGGANGGGIYSIGTVTLTGSTVSGNTTSAAVIGSGGGGIYDAGTTMTLTNTTVNNNIATTSNAVNSIGAGISHLAGTMNITDSIISNNNATATGTGTGLAGGIYNQQATLTLTRSTVSGNTAPIHAGIRTLASAAATTNIIQSAVINNTSTVEGGGVINASVGAATATTNITNSTIGNNSATTGTAGGVENFVTSTGNAIVNINYSTVASNTAGSGGGLGNFTGASTGVPTINLNSSIVADNTGGASPDITGIITSLGYNHVENTAGGTFTAATGDVTGTDPGLTALALNSGTTQNYAPGANSPVLNTIPPGTNGCGTTFNIDQRGFSRPLLNGCDKGSVELLGPTAAEASISGSVLVGSKGLASARVALVGAGGVTRTVTTNAFGNFTFTQVDAGATYIVNVSAKGRTFAPQVVSVTDNISGLTFIAQ